MTVTDNLKQQAQKKIFEFLINNGRNTLIKAIQENQSVFIKHLKAFLVEVNWSWLPDEIEQFTDPLVAQGIDYAMPKLTEQVISGLLLHKQTSDAAKAKVK